MENMTPLSRVEAILMGEPVSIPQSRVEYLLQELVDKLNELANSEIYEAKGSILFANLPTPSVSNDGWVYDVTDDFVTDSRFKTGAGQAYPGGTNVVIINDGTKEDPVYKYDVLGGFINMDLYVQKEPGKGLSTNDYSTAEKTKLGGIAEGAEVNVQSDWNESDNTSDAYIQNKPTLGTASALDVATSGDAGDDEVVKGNDSRLTDDRNPTLHTHIVSQITDFPVLGTAAGLNVPATGDASSSEVVKGDDSRVVNSPISGAVSGDDISVTDTADANVQKLTVYGRSHVSKNLLRFAKDTQEVSGVIFTIDKNAGTITLNGTATTGFDFYPFKTLNNIPTAYYYYTIGIESAYPGIKGIGKPTHFNVDPSATENVSPTDMYLRITSGTTFNNLTLKPMICLASAGTNFEPYGVISIGDSGSLTLTTSNSGNTKSSTATLTTGLPLCGIPVTSGETYTDGDGQKWLADTVDNNEVYKRVYKITFDGSEEIYSTTSGSTTGTNGSKVLSINLPVTAKSVSASSIAPAVCTIPIDTGNSIWNATSNYDTALYITSTGEKINIRVDGISDVAGLKAYLASNPLTIVYVLNTPTTTPLAPAEQSALLNLRTYDSTTNLSVTDDPFVDFGFLKNTENGKAVEQVAENAKKQVIDDAAASNATTFSSNKIDGLLGDKETKSVTMSYDEYNALASKDPNTSYYIPDAPDNWVFGFDIDNNDENPDTRVSYPADVDNAFFTPAYMDFANDVFKYGNWNFKPGDKFMPRPCMLKYDETVDYYLDPDDDTKKADGTASDVADTSYGGNAEMEWNKIYTKRWEENGVYHFRCSNIKWDADWDCWCNYDKNDNVIPHFYTPIYFGSSDGTRLRSLSGQSNSVNTTASQEIDLAKANGSGWFTEVTADWMLICDLLVMMCKSTNIQAKYGSGRTKSSNSSAINTGTMNTKGMFWGSNDETSGIKLFGMENLFCGNLWRRIAGYMYVDGAQKLKITRGTHDGSTATDYNTTGDGYIAIPNSTISSNNWLVSMKQLPYGRIPAAGSSSGSGSKYECDHFYQSTSGTRYALVGGRWNSSSFAGPFFVALANAPSYAYTAVGAALSCKPLAL